MIRDHYAPVDVFAQVPQLLGRMDPVLAQLDAVLTDDTLFCQIKEAMSQRAARSATWGRPSTPVDAVLRLLVVRRLYDWSYADTVHFVADSLVLRSFCRVYWEAVPHGSTLDRWSQVIGEEVLLALHGRVVELARQGMVSRGRKLRVDGTVVETTIHYPTDSSLLADGVRVLSRLLGRAKDLLPQAPPPLVRNRTRSATRLARQIGEAARTRSEEAGIQRRAVYGRLLAVTRAMLRQVEEVLPLVEPGTPLRDRLAHVADLTEQVVQQTVRRLAGEPVPAAEKVVSLVEEHTAILRRDKPRQQTEFGRRVVLGEAEGGIISSVQILPGAEPEAAYLEEAVQRQARLFGAPPRLVATDRGFSAKREAVRALGVQRVVIPAQGKQPGPEERTRWFRQGQRFRAGIEGRISVCKRRGWLGRCRDHGADGFTRWIRWGILVANLATIARHQALHPSPQAA